MSMPTVIITGASSGIGEACVPLFSEAGYAVVAAGRNPERTQQVVSGIENAISWTGDLRDSGAAQALVEAALGAFGKIDAVVNSAGIIHRATTEETTDAQWAETMDVNVTAVFHLCRAAMPHLRKTKGAIINISSDWGIKGGLDAMAYCASKGAVTLMTKAMALDHAREGIRVNAICPGDVDTPMILAEGQQLNRGAEAARNQAHADSPTGRMTTAHEVAALALYLASDAARQINGAAIPIDGGNCA